MVWLVYISVNGTILVIFSEYQRRWVFLPRRASTEMYTELADERRGTNCMISADEHFADVQFRHVTPLTKTRGFSAFQFLPGAFDFQCNFVIGT